MFANRLCSRSASSALTPSCFRAFPLPNSTNSLSVTARTFTSLPRAPKCRSRIQTPRPALFSTTQTRHFITSALCRDASTTDATATPTHKCTDSSCSHEHHTHTHTPSTTATPSSQQTPTTSSPSTTTPTTAADADAPLEGRLLIGFTCKVCSTRSYKFMSKQAYQRGVVIIRCDGCTNMHLIADHLGWFDSQKKAGTIEDIMREKGEGGSVKRVVAPAELGMSEESLLEWVKEEVEVKVEAGEKSV